MSAPPAVTSHAVSDAPDTAGSEAAAGATHELPDFIHQLIRDFIVYADQKGAFVFLAATTLVGYLVGAGARTSFGPEWSDGSTLARRRSHREGRTSSPPPARHHT